MVQLLSDRPCRQRLLIGQRASSNSATVKSLDSVPRPSRASEVFSCTQIGSCRFSLQSSTSVNYQTLCFPKKIRQAFLIPTLEEESDNRRLHPSSTIVSKAKFDDAITHLYGDRPYGHTNSSLKSIGSRNPQGGRRGGKDGSLHNQPPDSDTILAKSLKEIVKRLSSTIIKSRSPRCSFLYPEFELGRDQSEYPGPVRDNRQALIFGDENPEKIEEYSSDFYKTYFPVLKVD